MTPRSVDTVVYDKLLTSRCCQLFYKGFDVLAASAVGHKDCVIAFNDHKVLDPNCRDQLALGQRK